jgi:hypothetical protein
VKKQVAYTIWEVGDWVIFLALLLSGLYFQASNIGGIFRIMIAWALFRRQAPSDRDVKFEKLQAGQEL